MEYFLWFSDLMTFRSKVRYANSRVTRLGPKGEVIWFDKVFKSDNKLGLFLLPGYLPEISHILKGISYLESSKDFLVVDIGANVGQFGTTILRAIPNIKLASFEPNPVAYEFLKENIQGLEDKWQIFNFGIDEISRKGKLYYVSEKSAQGSLIKQNSGIELLTEKSLVSEIEVNLFTFQEAIKTNYSLQMFYEIDLLKVDVEGYEKSVLLGMVGTRYRFLWVEINNSNKSESSELELFLKESQEDIVASKVFDTNGNQIEFHNNFLFKKQWE